MKGKRKALRQKGSVPSPAGWPHPEGPRPWSDATAPSQSQGPQYLGTQVWAWSDVPTATYPSLLHHLPQRLMWHFLSDISFSLSTGSRNTLSRSKQIWLLLFWAHSNGISVKPWWVWQLNSRLRDQEVSSKKEVSHRNLCPWFIAWAFPSGMLPQIHTLFPFITWPLATLLTKIMGLKKRDFWTVDFIFFFLSLEKFRKKSSGKLVCSHFIYLFIYFPSGTNKQIKNIKNGYGQMKLLWIFLFRRLKLT